VKLSVLVVTYQQVDFSREALRSVFEQKTNFGFEVIVGDDASTDGTQEVLKEIQENAGLPVTLLLAPSNYGDFGRSNFMSTVDAAKGEYLAFLDGDDIWTKPDKLQKQVDFLDSHPDCALCVHRIEHVSEDGFRHLSPSPGRSGSYDIGELLVQNFAHKIATVVRRSAVDRLPGWYRTDKLTCADLVFTILTAQNAKIGFIDEVMAEHRLHGDSLTLRYGAVRLLSDNLAAFAALRPYSPQHADAFACAERRVRWKLRAARLGPSTYRFLQRLSARIRSIA
jgi:glycosyltransferase involved in cell wall biosynthesis